MKQLLLAALLAAGVSAAAEEKTCTVSGMHCDACKEAVEGKVCDQNKYASCEVTVDGKHKMGTVKLTTKETTAKIDEKTLGTQIEDAGYKLKGCKASAAKTTKKDKTAS